jgi:hypothetical protein
LSKLIAREALRFCDRTSETGFPGLILQFFEKFPLFYQLRLHGLDFLLLLLLVLIPLSAVGHAVSAGEMNRVADGPNILFQGCNGGFLSQDLGLVVLSLRVAITGARLCL